MPYNTLAKMRERLERLDLSNNNLDHASPAAQMFYHDLENLALAAAPGTTLALGGCNPVAAGLGWEGAGGRGQRGAASCARARRRSGGMAIKDITSEMDECFEAGRGRRAGPALLPRPRTPVTMPLPPRPRALFTLKAKRPGLRSPTPARTTPWPRAIAPRPWPSM